MKKKKWWIRRRKVTVSAQKNNDKIKIKKKKANNLANLEELLQRCIMCADVCVLHLMIFSVLSYVSVMNVILDKSIRQRNLVSLCLLLSFPPFSTYSFTDINKGPVRYQHKHFSTFSFYRISQHRRLTSKWNWNDVTDWTSFQGTHGTFPHSSIPIVTLNMSRRFLFPHKTMLVSSMNCIFIHKFRILFCWFIY